MSRAAEMPALTIDEVRARPIVTVSQYAAVLGLSPDTVYDAIKRGDLKALRLGRRLLLPTAPLLRALGLSPREERSAIGDLRDDG